MPETLTSPHDAIRQIKQMLVDDLQLTIVPDEIPDDYSLVEGGLALDSILIAELVARIEDRFGLQFDDRVMRAEMFTNLSLLGAFVARQCAESRAAEVRAAEGTRAGGAS